MNLKYKLEQNQINHPKIIKHVQELNVFINNLRDTNEEVLALELKSLCDELAEGMNFTYLEFLIQGCVIFSTFDEKSRKLSNCT